MRIRNRSLIIIFSRGLTQATGVILTIILVRLISKEMLGTFRQVSLVYLFLAGIFSLQLNNSLYYFLPKLGPQLRRTLLAQTIVATLGVAAIVAVAMFFGAEPIVRWFNNPDLAPLLRIYALYPLVNRLADLIPAFMISLDRPLRAGVYAFLRAVGHGGGVVTAFALGYGLTTVICLHVVIEAIVAVIGCADMMRLSPHGQWHLSRALVVEQLQYCWPLLVTAMVANVNVQFGKLLIASFFDAEVYAVYSCGAFEVPLIALVTGSVYSAIMPNLVVLANEGKNRGALQLWQEAARKCSLVIFPCFAFLLCVSRDLIVLMYGSAYAMAVWPFAIYLSRLPLRVAVYAALFRAAGQTKPIAISAAIGLVVNVVLSTLLVWAGRQSFLSYIGPAIGTAASSFVVVTYLLRRLCRTVDVPMSGLMRWRELGRTFGVSVLCAVFVFLLPLGGLPLAIRLGCRAVIFAGAFVLVMLWTRMLQEDELELLRLPLRAARRVLLGGRRR